MKDISQKWVQDQPDLQYLSQDIDIAQFQQEKSKRDFNIEFIILQKITETQYHCKELYRTQEFINHNRYQDILPFRHSMIVIPNSYINANYIMTPEQDKKLIATQGPLKWTVSQFWTMVRQDDINLIIMLCAQKQQEELQCVEYWPSSQKIIKIDDNFQIVFINEEKIQDKLYLRKFNLIYNDKQSEISQIQWLGWMDHSIVELSNNTIDLIIDKMFSHSNLVVHCSAGVGRSGVLISIFIIIMEINKKQNFSVFNTVRKIREQRWGMVQTQEQYSFIYHFIEQYLQKKNLI